MTRVIAASVAAAVALCLTACATPRATNAVSETMLRDHPEQLILVTIANPAEAVATRAGSTLRGYDGAGHYAASAFARSTVASLSKEYALLEIAAWPIDALRVHCIVFRIPDGSERGAVLTRLTQDARVRIAQPMQVFATTSVTYNDPYVELQNGFKALDIAGAHQWSSGNGIRVAIVDTGLDSGHPDLTGRVVSQANFVDRDTKQFLADRHGTGIAGVIAATGNNQQGIVGVAPGVKIVALKACWQLKPSAADARCNSFTLAQALSAALNANAHIVNLSISGPADPLLSELIDKGLKRGILYVGAAPPDGRAESFPVSNTGVIAVDAADRRSGYRNALPAPGADILTLTPAGHYDFSSGASLATAHVTGAVALLLQQNRKLDTQSITTLLQQSHGTSESTSINACSALAAINSRASCQKTLSESNSAQVR